VGEIIVAMMFLLPIYCLLILSYLYPEESMLFLERWKYREEPEFSEEAIFFTKFTSMVGLLFITFITISFLTDNLLIRLLFLIGLCIYIIVALYKFFSRDI